MLTQQHLPPPLTSRVKSSLFTHAHSHPLSLAARLHRCHSNHSYTNNSCTFSTQTSYMTNFAILTICECTIRWHYLYPQCTYILFFNVVCTIILSSTLFTTLYRSLLCQPPWWQRVSSRVWVLDPTPWGNWGRALWLVALLEPQGIWGQQFSKGRKIQQLEGGWDPGCAKTAYVRLAKFRFALVHSVASSLCHCLSHWMIKH